MTRLNSRKEDPVLEKHREEEMSLDDCYQDLFMGSDLGKKVLADLMLFCGYDESCFGKDNDETNKKLGTRVSALYIRDRINHKYTKNVHRSKGFNYIKEEHNGQENRNKSD